MYQIIAKYPTEYKITIGENCTLQDNFIEKTARILIVSDQNVAPLYAESITEQLQNTEVMHYTIKAGEYAKSYSTVHALEEFMQINNITKKDILIALGGGVVTDLVGFVGSIYLRGIKTIYIPTTMLAMVDAAIGGKTGINTKYGKNQIGTITSPYAVFIDPRFLRTQTKTSWNDGWVETLKHALLENEIAFNKAYAEYKKNPNNELEKILYDSCLTKNKIVSQDPYEKNIRACLNIGHSIGHAIESYHSYKVSHGQAVAIGIITESKIALELGIMNLKCFTKIYNCFVNLAKKIAPIDDEKKFVSYLLRDKKNTSSEIRMCLLSSIGEVYNKSSYLTVISNDVILAAIKFMNTEFNQDLQDSTSHY